MNPTAVFNISSTAVYNMLNITNSLFHPGRCNLSHWYKAKTYFFTYSVNTTCNQHLFTCDQFSSADWDVGLTRTLVPLSFLSYWPFSPSSSSTLLFSCFTSSSKSCRKQKNSIFYFIRLFQSHIQQSKQSCRWVHLLYLKLWKLHKQSKSTTLLNCTHANI